MAEELEVIFGEDEEPAHMSLPDLPTAYDLRPDLAELGIVEHERGVCQDTYENRSLLRRAKFAYDTVYDQMGRPTGLIAARSQEQLRERRVISLTEKRPLLSEPNNNNSDFLTGLDLMLEDSALKITPPWVVGATRVWLEEQKNGGPRSGKRQPAALPHRCRFVKTDGLRCMLWSSGRPKDDGLCNVHLGSIKRPGQDVERARAKIVQSAAYAVDVVEELMENATSEPVRLKAATEILDRAGVRGGVELDVGVDVNLRAPHEILAERLQRLAGAAITTAASLPDTKVIDAEPVMEVVEVSTVEEDGSEDDGK
jgi:hypothetical protein